MLAGSSHPLDVVHVIDAGIAAGAGIGAGAGAGAGNAGNHTAVQAFCNESAVEWNALVVDASCQAVRYAWTVCEATGERCPISRNVTIGSTPAPGRHTASGPARLSPGQLYVSSITAFACDAAPITSTSRGFVCDPTSPDSVSAGAAITLRRSSHEASLPSGLEREDAAVAPGMQVHVQWEGVFQDHESAANAFEICFTMLDSPAPAGCTWEAVVGAVQAELTLPADVAGFEQAPSKQVVAHVRAVNDAGLRSHPMASNSLNLLVGSPQLTKLILLASESRVKTA